MNKEEQYCLISLLSGWYSMEKNKDSYFIWNNGISEILVLNENIDYIEFIFSKPYTNNPEYLYFILDNAIFLKANVFTGENRIRLECKNIKRITLKSETFIPHEIDDKCSDFRKLGIRLTNIGIGYNEKFITLTSEQILESTLRFNALTKLNHLNIDMDKALNISEDSIFLYDYNKNSNGKINLVNQTSFCSHRSGWHYVLNILSDYSNINGIFFDGFLENNFSWSETSFHNNPVLYKQKWTGVLHNPHNFPDWWPLKNKQETRYIIETEAFKQSLEFCAGIYVLSDYLGDFLKTKMNVPINVLHLPTEESLYNFTFQNFLNNDNKSIIKSSWWLRKQYSFYKLHSPIISKINLLFNDRTMETINIISRLELENSNITITDAEKKSVVSYSRLSNREYDIMLSKNICFTDVYDSSANNIVVECIQRNTPLLINKHPAVVEYLGENYPFYFDSLEEASSKIQDFSIIEKTYEYLKNNPRKYIVSGEHFRNSFQNSSIYKNL